MAKPAGDGVPPSGGTSQDTALPLAKKYLVNGTLDQGVDYTAPCGTPMYAIGPGKVIRLGMDGFGPNCVVIQVAHGPLTGRAFYYGHAQKAYVGVGDTVKAGQHISDVGNMGKSFGCHVELGLADPSTGAPLSPSKFDTTQGQKLMDIVDALINNGAVPGDPGSGSGGGTTDTGNSDPSSIAKAAAFSTFLELPGLFDTFESRALSGQKSLMNDQPLLPFVQQLCQASLRSFQSMPNGNFFAFFPDYFGGLDHRTPYWQIDDIEIIDGGIDLSDDPLATHVYVVGDIVGFDGQVTVTDKLFSSGVVTIFNAFMADFINGLPDTTKKNVKTSKDKAKDTTPDGLHVDPKRPSLDNRDAALAFLQKYGARPSFEAMPTIRSPYFELFVAYQKFCLMWSQQFMTTFEFTFMPELFPGGIVAFPDHGIQCYVDEVVHSFDYETGFTTQANLMAPAALPSGDRQGVSAGMIRAFSFGPGDQPFDPFAPTDSSKKQKGS